MTNQPDAKQQPDNIALLPSATPDLANIPAECALIKIVYDRFAHYAAMSTEIGPGDFSQPFNAGVWVVFDVLFKAHGARAQVDQNVIADLLRTTPGVPEQVTTLDRSVVFKTLSSYLANPAKATSAEYYVNEVKDAAKRIRLFNTLIDAQRDTRDKRKPIQQTMDTVAATVLTVTNEHHGTVSASQAMDAFDQRMKDGGMFVKTGYQQIDNYGGARVGEVCMLAGGGGMGKTTFALSMEHNVISYVDDEPGRVVHFSFEMRALALMTQFIAMETGIYRRAFANGDLTSSQAKQYADAAARIKGWNYYIEDNFELNTPMSVWRRLAVHCAQERVKLCVIDGLWLMTPDKPSSDISTNYHAMTMDLIKMADALQVPVVLVHQYNAGAYKQQWPTLDALMGGLASARNMERIWLMSRKDYDKPDADTSPLMIREAKGREFGLPGTPYQFHYHWLTNKYEEHESGS